MSKNGVQGGLEGKLQQDVQNGNLLFPEPESTGKILSNGVLKVKIGHSYAAVARSKVRRVLHAGEPFRLSAANIQSGSKKSLRLQKISKYRKCDIQWYYCSVGCAN